MTSLLNCLNNIHNFDDVKKTLEDKHLMVKVFQNDGIYLVRYNKDKCDMKDSDIQKCRGLILNISDNSLVCYPPEKSLPVNNFLDFVNEEWSNVIVEEFVDGTMINISFNKNTDEWIISTRSCIGGKNKWLSSKNYKDMFLEASNNMDFSKLDKSLCYTFVLIHKDNRIVKEYNDNGLTLVNVREILENGSNIRDIYEVRDILKKQNINVDVPQRYTFNTYEDACKSAMKLNYQDQGYILKYGNYRSKIRNPSYNWAKNLKGNSNNMKYLYLELRQNGNLNDYINCYPEYYELFNQYQTELHDMTRNLHQAYISLHVKHDKNINEIPFQFRKLCYTLHGYYLSTKKPNTFNVVKNFVNKMDVPLQLFTINYKPRS